jgi:hypothetical protein
MAYLFFNYLAMCRYETEFKFVAGINALLHSIGWNSHFLYRRLKLAPIRMLWISEKDIVSVIHSSGGKILDVRPDDRAGQTIQSRTYYVSR